MSDRKRILVFESEKLMAASIASLLALRPEFDLVKTPVTSLACLDPRDSPPPDIVILDESLLAANIAAVVKLGDRQPTLRIIAFALGADTVQVFDKQVFQLSQLNDLLELLQSP